MVKDGRIEIEEPRLLRVQRDIQGLVGRVTKAEGQLVRPPTLAARYRLAPESAANPNVGGAGRVWLAESSSAPHALDEGAIRGSDGLMKVVLPGWYEIHGFLHMTAGAAGLCVDIRLRANGTTGRLAGATGCSNAASRLVAGPFNWTARLEIDDTVTVVTALAGAAGTLTPSTDSGVAASWIELVWRSEV